MLGRRDRARHAYRLLQHPSASLSTHWRPLESYWREGYLPAFISAAQSIKPPKPADYSVDDAKATLKKYAKAYDKSDAAKSDERAAAKEQFDSEKPTVIAIMNETFSDLSIYQNMRAGYEGPAVL